MIDDEDEIYIIDVIKHCIEKQNFSCAYIQKTFKMPYTLAGWEKESIRLQFCKIELSQ